MKKGKGTVAMRWFLSYFAILLIPFVVSICTYLYSYNITTEQTSRIYEALMTQFQSDSDRRLMDITKTFDDMSLKNSLKEASRSSRFSRSNDPYLMYTTSSELSTYIISHDYFEDVFLYFNNSQTLVGHRGHMDTEFYFDVFFKDTSVPFAKVKEFMNEPHIRDYITIKNLYGEECILFASTMNTDGWGSSNVTAVIVVKKSEFQKALSNLQWDDSISLYIADSAGKPIVSLSSKTDNNLTFSDLSDTSQFTFQKIGNEKSALQARDSSVYDWQYISVTPEALLKKSASSIQNTTIVGIILCMFFGILISFSLTRRSYKPIKRIIELMSPSSDENINNEYEWIEAKTKKSIQELSEIQHELGSHNKQIKNYFIFRLLETPFDLRRDSKEMKNFSISFINPYNLVVYFSFNYDQSFLLSSDLDKGKEALGFFITNIFEEIVKESYPVELTAVGDLVGAIINLPNLDSEHIEVIEDAVLSVINLAEEQFGAKLVSTIGDPHRGLEGIYSSSLEAKEALEYTSFLDGQSIVYFKDVKNLQQGYEYPADTEQKILNSIKLGDSTVTEAYIREVFAINKAHISGNMQKCLIFDLLGTMVKAVNQADSQSALKQIDFSVLTNVDSENGLIQTARNICESILIARAATPHNNKLGISVQKYVEDNYKNPDLNISQIGEHFNMTPAYLSSLFKEQTGHSLLESINTTRINAAKELLKLGESVVDIAGQVGFRNSGALIRVFKRIEGVTPKQYKSISD